MEQPEPVEARDGEEGGGVEEEVPPHQLPQGGPPPGQVQVQVYVQVQVQVKSVYILYFINLIWP